VVYRQQLAFRPVAGRLLDRAAFAALLLLSALFAFESTRPLIQADLTVLTNVETVLVVTIVLWLSSRLAAGRAVRYPRRLVIPILLWVTLLFVSTALAPAFQDKALIFMGRVVAGILIGLAAYDLASTPERWRRLILAMVLGGTAVALLGLAEGFGLSPVVAWLGQFKYAPTRVGDVLRISATLSYATIAAMIFELITPLALALVLAHHKPVVRLLAAGAVALLLVALVLTLSRAGILALWAALGLMLAAGLWRRSRSLVLASLATAALLLVLVFLVLFYNPTARLRLTTETERAWYQAQYVTPQDIQAKPGEILSVPVQVTNTSARTWLAGGELPFALAYHLYDGVEETLNFTGPRSWLIAPIAPGQTAVIQAQVAAPAEPGEYRIEWDMVQETVTWFSWKDSPTASTTLVVTGQAVEQAPIVTPDPPTDVKITNPTPGRFDLWRAAITMAADFPLLGVGPDSFRWQFGAYAGLDEWDTGIHANNLYIEWLADTGLLGLLAFLWLTWRLARLSLGHLRHIREEAAWLLTLGLIASLLAWYVHGFFDYFFEFTPTYVAFWLIVALLAGAPPRRHDGITDRI
jgi:hypothetical protein